MIHVEPQPEPADFDARVRQPGLSAFQELMGNPPTIPRPGPRRQPIAGRIEDIPPDELPPFWRECLEHLHDAYRGICAYVCVYIDPVTGHQSVDHFIAKSLDPSKAYEWSNYRLACGRMNGHKSDIPDCLDPFEVEDGWFRLDMIAFQLKPASHLPDDLRQKIEDTIVRLKLNDPDCREIRRAYWFDYVQGHISLEYLDRRCPLVAREIRRQGALLS